MNKKLFLAVILTISTLIGCSININSVKSTINNSGIEKNTFMEKYIEYEDKEKHDILNKIKNKPIFDKKYDLKINSSLNNKPFMVKDLKGDDFNFDNIEQKKIIFKNRFKIEGNSFLYEIPFKVTDYSKKYSLYVKRESAFFLGDFSVNIKINGLNIANNLKFDNLDKKDELIDNIVLNANNLINISINGKLGNEISVYIIDNSTGAIRKSNIIGNNFTNESHIKNKDTNIFDIADKNTLSSFSYDQNIGDQIFDGGKYKISSINVNQENNPTNFESECLVIEVKKSSDIDYFKTLYDFTILDNVNGFYKIKINLDKSPIDKIFDILNEYNKGIPINIKSIDFSSLSSLKTFAVYIDLKVNHNDKLKSVDFNFLMKLNGVLPKPTTNDWEDSDDPNQNYLQTIDQFHTPSYSWWLSVPNVLESWNYSIGTNSKIAHIDGGFNMNHPEIIRRGSSNNILGVPINIYNEKLFFHGHNSIMTCCAERNNGIKTVGVSPNAYAYALGSFFGTMFDYQSAFNDCKFINLDVISFNSGSSIKYWLLYIPAVTTDFSLQPGKILTNTINDLISQGKTVVISAGNNAKPIKEFFPACLGDVSINDGVIVVGGVQINKDQTGAGSFKGELTAGFVQESQFKDIRNLDYHSYDPNISLDKNDERNNWNGKGSNYSNNLVWAPWENVTVSAHDYASNKSDFDNITPFSGTSAAEPFIAGVVADIRARVKLTPQQIEEVLLDPSSSLKNVAPHNFMIKDGFGVQRLLDVESAIKNALIKAGKNPSDYVAKNLIGKFKLDNPNLLSYIDISTNNKPFGTIFLRSCLKTITGKSI